MDAGKHVDVIVEWIENCQESGILFENMQTDSFVMGLKDVMLDTEMDQRLIDEVKRIVRKLEKGKRGLYEAFD